jgi:hypothetical protein
MEVKKRRGTVGHNRGGERVARGAWKAEREGKNGVDESGRGRAKR